MLMIVGLEEGEEAQDVYLGNFQSLNTASYRYIWENTTLMSLRVMNNSSMQPRSSHTLTIMKPPLIMISC
jgi:hypothetical protein